MTIAQYDEFGNEIAAVTTSAAVVAAPKTRIEKLIARSVLLTKRLIDTEKELTELQLEIQTGGRLDTVKNGSIIVARLGRAGSAAIEAVAAVIGEDGVTVVTPAVEAKAATDGTLKQVQATVLGIKEHTDGSMRYKLAYGSGFEADTVIVQSTQILEIITA